MVGFVIGTVCLVALVRVLRRTACYAGGRGHACGARPFFGAGGRLRSRRWFLRPLFERLDTTPGQEKAIVAALEDLMAHRATLREEARRTRGDLARLVSSGWVDEAALEETFARHDRLLAQVRVSFTEALKKATEALDEPQRNRLAAWLERGGRFGGDWDGSSPYRGVWL